MGDDERGVAELENKATVGGARRDLTIYIVAPPAADVGVDDEGHRDWEHGRSECQEKQAAQRRHHMKTSAMKRSTSEISFAGDKQQPAVPRTMDVEGKDAGERARPNILIAGTPGCGKTTTSALIAVRESSARTPGSSSVSLTAHYSYSHLRPLLPDLPVPTTAPTPSSLLLLRMPHSCATLTWAKWYVSPRQLCTMSHSPQHRFSRATPSSCGALFGAAAVRPPLAPPSNPPPTPH